MTVVCGCQKTGSLVNNQNVEDLCGWSCRSARDSLSESLGVLKCCKYIDHDDDYVDSMTVELSYQSDWGLVVLSMYI